MYRRYAACFSSIAVGCALLASQASGQDAADAGGKIGSAASKTIAEAPRSKLVTGRAQPTKLPNARTIEGSLDAQDRKLDDGSFFDAHGLSLAAGDRVVASMRSSEFDPYLVLARSNGDKVEVLAQNDDGGGGQVARIEATVDRAGSYVLLANSAKPGMTGAYQISVEVDGTAPALPSIPTGYPRLLDGQEVEGTLDPASDLKLGDNTFADAFEVTATAGQVFEIALSSSEFDPYLILALPDGTRVASDHDSGGGGNSAIRLTIPRSGTYIVLANAMETTGRGPYTLSLRSIPRASTSVARPDLADLYRVRGDPSSQYAVLVGIDDYPGEGLRDLTSCIVDTRVMRRALIEHLGFKPENIVVLQDAEATREHIMQAIKLHLGQAGPDGSAFFYFSGHGMQLDENLGQKDGESDGKDESLLVWDQGDKATVILDDEIGFLLGQLKAGTRVAVLDSCHSGTATLGVPYKSVTPEAAKRSSRLFALPTKFEVGEVTATDGMFDGPSDHILLSACKADEEAIPGEFGAPSVFTYALVREIERGGGEQPLSELIVRVRETVDYIIREVMQRDHAQTPQLEGRDQGRTVRKAFRD